ncbi:MAG: hypothetical protein NTW62_01185 [Candidatus Nomurabacteria bacterium]|nr:hypothetical protein [Candidatus Nomurabacteria bacterium]
MKKYSTTPLIILKLEKDNKDNPTGMQLRIWSLDNGTTIVVRLLEHDESATQALWNKKTNGEVNDFILGFLKKQKIIKKISNWHYDNDIYEIVQEQDEFEEADECVYFCWKVKSELISKF